MYHIEAGREDDYTRDNYRCTLESRTYYSAGGWSSGSYLLFLGLGHWWANRQANQLYAMCMDAAGWESDEARDARAMQYLADLDACKEQADGAADFATAMNACRTARGYAPADAFGIAMLRCMPKLVPIWEEQELPPDLVPGIANCLEAHGAITRPMADDWIACYAEHGLDLTDPSALDHSDFAACLRARGNWQ